MEEPKAARAKITEKAHCPTCNRSQNCDVHGRIDKPWSWSDHLGNSTDGGVIHTLFECCGCERVFYEMSSWDDNDLDRWYDRNGEEQCEAHHTKQTFPTPASRPRPDWLDNVGNLDPALVRILDEAYRAYELNCYILASVGLRTALDSCVTAVKIDPAKSFEEKLGELRDGGFIGETEHDLLTVLTDAGNAAAHRGWSPDKDELVHLFDILETFIKRVLVNGKLALAMKDAIPKRPARQKK